MRTEAIYLVLATERESRHHLCLKETQRQAAEWEKLQSERKGRL